MDSSGDEEELKDVTFNKKIMAAQALIFYPYILCSKVFSLQNQLRLSFQESLTQVPDMFQDILILEIGAGVYILKNLPC